MELYNARFRFKKDSETNFEINDPVLLDGEMVLVETEDGIKIKVGNGYSKYSELDYLESINSPNVSSLPSITSKDYGKIIAASSEGYILIKNCPLWDNISNKPSFHRVATEGTYASLKEKPFGDIPVVLEETELPFEEDKQYNIYIAGFVAEDEPVPGETYKVIWDGTEYFCVCHNEKIHENIDMEIIPYWFGNQTLFWNMGLGENSGEPFCIWRGNTEERGFAIETLDTDAAHTVSIVPVNTVKKLEKKYLPEDTISAADVAAMFASAGIVEPAAVEDNSILTDKENDIYVY